MSEKKLITCQASSPGKIILHGEHSVVYGKTAIAASLDLRTISTIKEIGNDNNNFIVVNFPNLKLENLRFDYEDIKKNLVSKSFDIEFTCESPKLVKHEEYLSLVNDYLQYFQVQNEHSFNKSQFQAIEIFLYIYSAISRSAEYEFKSFDLTVSSDLTIGSGIGSSASFAVSLTASILQYIRLKSPTSFSFFGIDQSLNEYNSIIKLREFDKNLISAWAFCCEKISHGNPSGVDNEVCCQGSILEFQKGVKPILHKFTKKLNVYLVNTHVERNTKDLVEKVKLLTQKYPNILDNIMIACDNLAIEALKVLKTIEDEENSDMCDGHFHNLSELFKINHNLLKTIGVSHPSLEKIFEISNDFGFGSKLTGAGGGGYAIILIPPYNTEVGKLTTILKENGFDGKLTSLGGEGIIIEAKYF